MGLQDCLARCSWDVSNYLDQSLCIHIVQFNITIIQMQSQIIPAQKHSKSSSVQSTQAISHHETFNTMFRKFIRNRTQPSYILSFTTSLLSTNIYTNLKHLELSADERYWQMDLSEAVIWLDEVWWRRKVSLRNYTLPQLSYKRLACKACKPSLQDSMYCPASLFEESNWGVTKGNNFFLTLMNKLIPYTLFRQARCQ